ncbi:MULTISPECIES: hypothetical protein [Microbacterium]|uniref:hypothetical protein n=1 Tax=Microbacterium TaxID=33882 RepID=UPI000F8C7B17|nr:MULTISPECIES: hypothetical protein [Microbacterium]
MSLALLLLFAFAVTAHGDAGENGAAPSLAAAAIDAFDDTAAIGADAETDEAQAQAALPVAVTSTLVGAALCILGVLCGLAAMLLLSRVLGRPGQFSTLRETPRALRSDPASPLHPCGTAVSLIRLGLSRT